jgi:DNA-binding Lrp family transcriptional regulator
MTARLVHPFADIIPPMMTDELADLERDIVANGLRQAITLFDGKILDGRHRYAVCTKLGIEPTVVNFEGTADEAKALALSLNVHRRHLTFEQRQAIVDRELRTDPSQSDRAIAAKAKVSHPTVAKQREKLVRAGTVETVTTVVGKDGVAQSATKAHGRKPAPMVAGERVAANPIPDSTSPTPEPSIAVADVQIQKAVIAILDSFEDRMRTGRVPKRKHAEIARRVVDGLRRRYMHDAGNAE